jgi:hypothetical protein
MSSPNAHPPKAPASAAPTAEAPQREPGTSEGMSAKTPDSRSPRNEDETLRDSANIGLALPHERDQSNAMTESQPDPMMAQASRDLARGLQDTSKRPQTDKAYEKLRDD